MLQWAIHVPTRSAGSMSSDCPIPYQLKIWPPRPGNPNSGYSFGNTCGCEVQIQCVVCRRCMVSAVPSSPDCTTKARSPAVRHNRNKGSRSRVAQREVIVLDGNKSGRPAFGSRLPSSSRESRRLKWEDDQSGRRTLRPGTRKPPSRGRLYRRIMSTCSSCGTILSVNVRFCSSCGKPVADTDDVATMDLGAFDLPTVTSPLPPRPPSASGSRSSSSRSSAFPEYAVIEGRFLPGRLIAGRYRIIALLGKGGMGEVYRADDLTLGQAVALKFLPDAAASDEALLERFRNEVRIARRVSHPNVCRVYDVGEVDGQTFFTMEYVDGEDLASLLRRIGRLPHDKAVEIARQLCAGLAAAHERGVVHRDLKPANVMIDGDGNVRITDFGLAVAAGTAGVERAGTPQYMAPEQLAGQPATIQSDIYALGLILFEVFTGRRAFDAKTMADLIRQHEDGSITTPSSVVHDLDPAVERIIMRCLEKDPLKRPASALVVAAALPGANPLADALAAGETPSPELLAAAAEEQALPLAQGLALLAAIVGGVLVYAALAGHASIVGRVPLDKPAAVLIDRAQAISRALGYTDTPVDSAFGTTSAADYLAWLVAHDWTPHRWDVLSRGTPAGLFLWYRTSPRPMTPLLPFSIRPNDPPLNDTLMRIVVVDTLGRLREFHAVPPQFESEAGATPPADWSAAFDAAGLDERTFAPATPEWTPRDFADARS